MTKNISLRMRNGVLPKTYADDLVDAENDASWLPQGSISFPGARYFNEKTHEKRRPERVVKFRTSRTPENNY